MPRGEKAEEGAAAEGEERAEIVVSPGELLLGRGNTEGK